jgi:hypothetical protein
MILARLKISALEILLSRVFRMLGIFFHALSLKLAALLGLNTAIEYFNRRSRFFDTVFAHKFNYFNIL